MTENMLVENFTQEELPIRQRKAVLVLAATGNTTRAAKEAGVTQQTVYRWLEDPTFRNELRAAELQVLENLSRRLMDLTSKAITTLDGLLSDKNSTTRLRAAQTIIEGALKLREIMSIEERVAKLEAQYYGPRTITTN